MTATAIAAMITTTETEPTTTEPEIRGYAVSAPLARGERLLVHGGGVRFGSTLSDDAERGFRSALKYIEPKHFYDARGSLLFDAICDTPEYYVMRTEQALLDREADNIIKIVRPTHLVELGSGAARKTRTLLEAMHRSTDNVCYAPIDISEDILVDSGRALLADYPWLRIEGTVADFSVEVPVPSGRRLFALLGGTLGNFPRPEAVRFLARIQREMTGDDALLLGIDRVKSPAVLHAAYNDAAGVTAAFNRNVLHVLNRRLFANFDVSAFEHVAYYRPELERVEMHLESRRKMAVDIRGLDRTVYFAAGERIHTESSQKFTPESAAMLVQAAGLSVQAHYTPKGSTFSLLLLR